MLILAAAFVVISVALYTTLMSTRAGSELLYVSGSVEAKDVAVGSKVGGRLSAIHVQEGDSVKTGILVAEFDLAELAAQRLTLEANLLEAQAVLSRLENGARPQEIAQARARHDGAKAKLALLNAGTRGEDIAAAKANVEALEVEHRQALSDLARADELFAQGVMPKNKSEYAQTAVEGLAQAVEAATKSYEKALAGPRSQEIAAAEAELDYAASTSSLVASGSRVEDISAAQARIEAIEAQLAVLDVSLGEGQVLSPCNGTVLSVVYEPGDILAPGAGVVSVLVDDTNYVQVFVPQGKLGWVQPGMVARIEVDTYPGEQFEGVVTFLSTQGEFTPRNLQTKEKRVDEVFRAKLKVSNSAGKLRPGMVCDVVFKRPGAQ